ncbi:MAG: glycosyltransferase family 39 protein [Bryobacterales bacterium]|nr:glycosyltransferase family 39 protein [Bryobacteraceae bacterium]MDW8353261.1 glycosyltransferase family 39 protein [Bryobacterales bacterium]
MFGGETLARENLLRDLSVLAGFFLLVFGLQWAGGAYRADFTGHPDEAAHFVTGLMVRDYIAAGAPAAPRAYAENYYFHYPKVAIGHWPPFFYVVQAVWMLFLPPSRFTIILLMTSIAAASAWFLYSELRRRVPELTALFTGAVFVLLPLVQAHTGMVMAEMLVALLGLLASIRFTRYLERGRGRDALLFGLLAALAILTKPIGVVLAAVPPVGVLLSGRLDLLKRWSFWAPAAIVLGLCAPWYFIVDRAFHDSWVDWGGIGIYESPWRLEWNQWHAQVGKALLFAAGLGFLSLLVSLLRTGHAQPCWAVAAGLLGGFLAFRAFVGASHEARVLLVGMPAFLMFVANGMAAAGSWVARSVPRARVAAACIVALATSAFFVERFRLVRRSPEGFAEAAADLMSRKELRNSVILVSSLLLGEGALIAEVALRDERPGRIVLRATKVLASVGWNGEDYDVRLDSPDQVAALLESIPVGVVVWDRAPGLNAMQHHDFVVQALRRDPGRWEPIGFYPRPAAGSPRLEVYRQVGHEGRQRKPIRLDLRNRLGKILER